VSLIQPVVRRYVRSFLLLNDLAQAEKDVQLLTETFKSTPDLLRILTSPIYPKPLKSGLISKVFSETVSKGAFSFLNYLLSKDRIFLIADVLLAAKERIQELHSTVSITVVSAHVLTPSSLERIVKTMKDRLKKKCLVETKVSPSILGGFQIYFQNRIVDHSVQGKLDQLKNSLLVV
jgi:F-type H+-transporting ATPase subunit delta